MLSTGNDGDMHLVVDSHALTLLDREGELQNSIDSLEQDIKQTKDEQGKNDKRLQSLNGIKDSIDGVTETLKENLHKANQLREAGLIATRVAILGLLVYLVQIFLSRYRYHIRLAKFYQGRAHALYWFAADEGGTRCLSELGLDDLAQTLTPDDISPSKFGDRMPMAILRYFRSKFE